MKMVEGDERQRQDRRLLYTKGLQVSVSSLCRKSFPIVAGESPVGVIGVTRVSVGASERPACGHSAH